MTDDEYLRWDNSMAVAVEVVEERERQDAKFGEQSHPDDYTTPDDYRVVRAAQFEDEAKRLCRLDVETGQINWKNILDEEVKEAFTRAADGDQSRLREELIQVAAVAVNWIECIDRRKR